MSKLLDRLHIHHDAPERRHETPEVVPESHEVREHGLRTTPPPRRAATGIRWLRWLPLVALFAAGILAFTMLVNDSGTDVGQEVIESPFVAEGPGSNSLGPTGTITPAPAYQQVQDAIDEALAANAVAVTPTPAYQQVQDAIDEALAANAVAATPTPAYQQVQDAIDEALAANEPASEFTPWLTPTTGPGSTQLGPTD